MKFFLSMILVIVMICSLSVVCYGASLEDNTPIENSGVLLNDPTLTKDQIKKNKDEADRKDSKFAQRALVEVSSLSSDPDGEGYFINVTNFAQETTYWCGPASARQTLSYHKVKSGSSTSLPSQTTLASKAGTTTDGSSTSGLRNALNYYSSIYNFSSDLYVVGDISSYSNPVGTLETRIKNDLKYATNAPILLVQTLYLPRYNGKSIRHYNTVSGYSYEYASGNKEIRMVDPHYSSTYQGVFWDPLGSTTVNGVGRAVYKADLEGTNYVMCY